MATTETKANTENAETKAADAAETKSGDQEIVDAWLKGGTLQNGVSVRLTNVGGESVWVVERKGS